MDNDPTTNKGVFKHDVDEPGVLKRALLEEMKLPLTPHTAFGGLVAMVWLEGWRLFLGLRRAWQSYRAGGWLTSSANVGSGNVYVRRAPITENWGIELADAQLPYSYRVDGEYYAGYYEKTFRDEQDAWDFVGGWKGRSVVIRRHPRRPGISVLRLQDM
jgi:hypothetical protein